MTKHSLLPSFALALALGCGGGGGAGGGAERPPAAPSQAEATESLSEEASALEPVAPGEYRLEMSATCRERELTATGTLRLAPISASDDSAAAGADSGLLWGQMDLDFAPFARCLGQSSASPGDPIHPGVLVEVLRWDGVRHHQVLLVSTDAARPDGSHAGGGVAMWVERVDSSQIAGIWSRWELMGHGEGRWHAERVQRSR
jgi:hypothetical protein